MRVCFSVRDTGIGIAPEKQAQLFQPFTQLEAGNTRKYGGSGLGLNISQRLVGLMGGEITVQSKPGVGSTFLFEIPISQAVYGVSGRRVFFDHQPLILMMDDNELVLELAKDILGRAGASVITVNSLSRARQVLREEGHHIRLAILDWRMGQEDGLDLALEMYQHSQWRRLPVLMTSAWSREGLHGRMESMGLTHFLAKPMTENALLAKVDELLNGSSHDSKVRQAEAQGDQQQFRELLRGTRVLLAEDEAIIRLDLAEMLGDAGYEVVGQASDGEQAVALAESLQPDLAILDIKMPVMDGLSAAEAIGEKRICPVVMLTAFSQKELVERARDAGVMAYVVKPFTAGDVTPAIEVARSRWAERKALESEVADLGERLETRKAVEKAKGVLMKKLKISEAEAFRWIQKTAMDRRLGMREVADAVVAGMDKA